MIKKFGLAVVGALVLGTALLGYNAVRHFVIWSPTEAVVFDSAGVRLAGTLIKPAEGGPFPAIAMLHGSGPETRGDPWNRVTARAFTRRGLAVLIYDKRGTGASGGSFETALYRDFIADAKAAVRYLAGRADIDGARIGLFGISESGWFTPEIALEGHAIAFVINRVGPPLPWVEIVAWENRHELLAEGVAQADLARWLALSRRSWDYLSAAARDPALAASPERAALDAAIGEFRATVPLAERLMAARLPPYDPELYRKFENYGYDPGPFLRRLEVPMLYVFGEEDVNVPTAQSVAYLESLRAAEGKDITIRVLPGVGHSFFTWTGLLEALYPSGYLEFIGAWAAEQVAKN